MSRRDQENCVSNNGRSIDLPHRPSRIRRLNDKFRASFEGGKVLVTWGVRALGPVLVDEFLQTVRQFDGLDQANDPYNEHNFGSFSSGGQRVCWKIDYYDRSMQFGSIDPSNEAETVRVLTVMLTSEY